jgi:opacity protein-like surface antigen
MRRIAYGATAVALGVMAGVSTAAAQRPYEMESGSTRPISIGIGGGVSVPVSDYKKSFDNGFNGQGFIRFNLPGLPISPRIDFTWQRLDMKDVETGVPGVGTVDGYNQILGGLANLTYGLSAGPIRPYILAGLGVYNLKFQQESEDGGGSFDESETKFGVNGGAGITFRLGRIAAYLEGRIDNVWTSDDQDVEENLKTVRVIPVTFGIVF